MKDETEESDLIFGRHPVAAALKEGIVNKLWLLRGPGGSAVDELVRLAREQRVVFQWVDRQRMAGLVPGSVHQGAAARISAYRYQTLDDLWALGQPAPLVVLDGITDPHNLGAILRNAAFFGAGGVILPRWRAAGITGAVAKAAAGTLGMVPVVQVANTAQTLLELKERGYWVFGAAAEGEPCDRWDVALPAVLVIGAEGEGLHRLVRERCDRLIAVPGSGRASSLNASCATAALLYELFRRGRAQPSRV
ncbi:MAG: 23S rRNA (guanosine(2251)-2'-O)-methyltransferase RlmB [Elusimicrobia bacterium]|nr:23S rRNA (guanosine(2251)-2'-O)-methyltransferase RlmB [Elusimicrobiota bacterium]